MPRKNPHAVALGRRGGSANTPQQKAARKRAKKGAGRPVTLCPACGKPGRAHRWYRGERHCPT